MAEPTLTIEPKSIALADKAVATVRITGTKPLQVVVPKSILDDATSLNWNVALISPPVESRDGAKFVWQQQYQLSPFIVGNNLPVQLTDFVVNDTPVSLPAGQVSVSTSVQSLTNADVRPITPLELSPGSVPANTSLVILLGVLAGLGLLLSVAATWLLLRRKAVSAVPTTTESLRHDLSNWVPTADKAAVVELARRIRIVFVEPANEEQAEHFNRLDRWQFSSVVPTVEEVQAELDYWRGVLGAPAT
jgi:hypothetical protein